MKGKFLLAISLTCLIVVIFPLRLLADKTDEQYRHAHEAYKKRNFQNAQHELEKILKAKPDYEKAKILLGLTHFMLSQKSLGEGAVAELREALRLQSDEAYWHSELARQLNAMGEKVEAVQECAQAAKLSPDDSGLAAGCGLKSSENAEEKGSADLEEKTKAGDHVFVVGDDVSPPKCTYHFEPRYSGKARLIGYHGTLKLWAVINAQGEVESTRVVEALGLGLDQNALRTVSGWKFTPAVRNGMPVSARVRVEVTFRLF